MAAPAGAQVQRNFVNLSFEQPALQTAGCRVYIASNQVPGWQTTHPAQATENAGGCVVPAGFSQTAPILELWRTPRDASSGGTVNAPDGVQIAELNAAVASRIYQNICLINGEQVTWRFSHRGRSSATVRDVAQMKVGATASVVQVATSNNGTYDAPVAYQGTVSAANVAGNATWVNYNGQFVYGGASGLTNIGFESISAAGGTANGNLLDNIQVSLAPFVDFGQPSSSSPEGTGGNLPALRMNGTISAPITVTVQITGGTATLGTDYHTPGDSTTLTVSIPAGTYDGSSASSLFPLPVTVVDDAIAEGNETIDFTIQPSSATVPQYLLSSSGTCGGAVQTTWTYTIVDDDAQVALSKNAAPPVVVGGDPSLVDIIYTIMASNPSTTLSASYALVDTPSFDPDTSIVSASYTLNGGTSAALSGSGPWTLQGQWRALAAGVTDTYVVTVRARINRGGGTGNDACTAPTSASHGLHNAARATVQASGGGAGATFDAAACQPTPTPVWVVLGKQLQGRAIPTDQAQVRLYSGGILKTSATTSGSTVPASASTGVVVLPAGNTLQFNESIKTNGTGADRSLAGYLPQLSCTNTGTATPNLPSGSGTDGGTSQNWPEFTPAAGADLACTITNTLAPADLAITKTNTPAAGPSDQAGDTVVSGSQTTYTLVVTNRGSGSVTGAVVTDPASSRSGITCPTANVVTCTGSATGVCPSATTTVGALGAGFTLGTLPSNGTATLTFSCTVN